MTTEYHWYATGSWRPWRIHGNSHVHGLRLHAVHQALDESPCGPRPSVCGIRPARGWVQRDFIVLQCATCLGLLGLACSVCRGTRRVARAPCLACGGVGTSANEAALKKTDDLVREV